MNFSFSFSIPYPEQRQWKLPRCQSLPWRRETSVLPGSAHSIPHARGPCLPATPWLGALLPPPLIPPAPIPLFPPPLASSPPVWQKRAFRCWFFFFFPPVNQFLWHLNVKWHHMAFFACDLIASAKTVGAAREGFWEDGSLANSISWHWLWLAWRAPAAVPARLVPRGGAAAQRQQSQPCWLTFPSHQPARDESSSSELLPPQR